MPNNGHTALADDRVLVVTPDTHTYTTQSGVVFELRPVSAVLLRRMERDTHGKPTPPIVETEVGPKKVKQREVNPDDPDYKLALAEWDESHKERMLVYLFAHGIVNGPSPDEMDALREYLPGEKAEGIKYAWVLEMLSNDQEIADLAQAIMGQSVPTDKGIRAAEDRFQGDGERATD